VHQQTFIFNQTMMIIQEHYALFIRNHYRWIIGRTHRKRERDIAKWGEREREETEREYGVDIYRGQLFLVSTIILNQHKIFRNIATGHICTELFRDACKYYNRCSGLFLSNGFSGAMTSTRITMRFSIINSLN